MLAALIAIAVAPSYAQPNATADEPRSTRDRHATRPRGHSRGAGQALGLARRLFQLGPEDKGSLTPAEEKELLAFAEKNLPRLHKALRKLKQRRPDRYRRKLDEYAPRLRLMKRVYQHSPKLGHILRQHIENEFRVRRRLHALRRESPGSPVYQTGLRRVREYVADSVQLEIEALRVLAALYEERRDERIQARLAHVTGGDADLPRLPPKLRNLINEYRAANTPSKQVAVRDKIEQLVARHLDAEVKALRQRTADLENRVTEEVDVRFDQLLDAAKKRGPPSRGHDRGSRRRR